MMLVVVGLATGSAVLAPKWECASETLDEPGPNGSVDVVSRMKRVKNGEVVDVYEFLRDEHGALEQLRYYNPSNVDALAIVNYEHDENGDVLSFAAYTTKELFFLIPNRYKHSGENSVMRDEGGNLKKRDTNLNDPDGISWSISSEYTHEGGVAKEVVSSWLKTKTGDYENHSEAIYRFDEHMQFTGDEKGSLEWSEGAIVERQLAADVDAKVKEESKDGGAVGEKQRVYEIERDGAGNIVRVLASGHGPEEWDLEYQRIDDPCVAVKFDGPAVNTLLKNNLFRYGSYSLSIYAPTIGMDLLAIPRIFKGNGIK